jgi:hypothetical protein
MLVQVEGFLEGFDPKGVVPPPLSGLGNGCPGLVAKRGVSLELFFKLKKAIYRLIEGVVAVAEAGDDS